MTPTLDSPALGEYWGGLLTSPTMCAIAARMGAFVRTAGDREGSFSHADREFVDQVLSADWRTNVVQGVHVRDAVATGVRLEAIEALRDGREERLDEHERLLARFIRQVVSGTVDDATFAAIETYLGKRGLLDDTRRARRAIAVARALYPRHAAAGGAPPPTASNGNR